MRIQVFWVQGVRASVEDGVTVSGIRLSELWSWVSGFGFRVSGLGVLGFRVCGFRSLGFRV